jgi:hypothetical protein
MAPLTQNAIVSWLTREGRNRFRVRPRIRPHQPALKREPDISLVIEAHSGIESFLVCGSTPKMTQ